MLRKWGHVNDGLLLMAAQVLSAHPGTNNQQHIPLSHARLETPTSMSAPHPDTRSREEKVLQDGRASKLRVQQDATINRSADIR
jgi:hypothetical protein